MIETKIYKNNEMLRIVRNFYIFPGNENFLKIHIF